MRGHRSRFAHFALALLLGAAGTSSFAHDARGGTPAPVLDGRGAEATAPASPLWSEALGSPSGFVGFVLDERTGPEDGGRPRPAARSEARRAWSARRVAGRPAPTSRRAPSGARLLGLPTAPANAPPGS